MTIKTYREMMNTPPSKVDDGDAFAVKVVAVAGHSEDWAAYAGPTDLTDEEIAEGGDKLAEEEVKRLFYVMHTRYYRR